MQDLAEQIRTAEPMQVGVSQDAWFARRGGALPRGGHQKSDGATAAEQKVASASTSGAAFAVIPMQLPRLPTSFIMRPDVIDKALPKLRVVSKWGTGLDSIDLAAAKSRGLPVCNTPAAFKDAVAEIALGFMLELARGVARTDNAVRQGDWPKLAMPGLIGKSVGIIGFGAIGRGIALRAAAFGMTVNFYDPFYTDTAIDEFEQKSVLADLLVSADYVCLACNMSDENFHLIDADELSQMPRGACLINVARGPLVNEAALVEALSSGHLGGAGLDVFEHEPLPEGSELRRFENVVLGSHNANNVVSVVEAVHQNTLENLYKYF